MLCRPSNSAATTGMRMLFLYSLVTLINYEHFSSDLRIFLVGLLICVSF